MNYRILVVATLVGLAANSYAAENEMATSESDSDARVACIEAAISEEIDDENIRNQFIESCYQEKIAQKQKPAGEKTPNS